MPRLAANLTTMFHELEMPLRFGAAADCGFRAVEMLFPYAWHATDIASWLEAHGLSLILINTHAGDNGEMGFAAVPGKEDTFQDSFSTAADYARTLGIPMIHVMTGRADASSDEVRSTFIENLRWAADQVIGDDLVLNLEPLNLRDVPGYFHTRCEETAALIEAIGRDNVRLQFDLYHQQIMGGDLVARFDQYRHLVSHVQFSSLPGRNEPGYGEVNVPFFLDHLDHTGYDGWVGCEYTARGDTRQGLSWARPWGIVTD